MSEFTFRRVVIACDAVGDNRSGIEIAASLAACWNAALRGVFVQDEALLHLAALPFSRQIGPGGEISEERDESTVLSQFEIGARQARTALEAAARAHEVGWSFEVVRGQTSLATLALDAEDLLVIEAMSRPFAGEFRLASRWLQAAYQAQRPILLVRNLGSRKDRVVALVQKSDESTTSVIDAAARLALAADRRLTILLSGADLDPDRALETVRLVSVRLAARCRIEKGATEAELVRRFADEASLLVVDARPAVNDAASLKALTAECQADILFLR
jgi:hypothetical protein